MAPAPRSRFEDGVAVLSVAYLALAFGWRSWVQWKRTGDSGFRLSRSAPPAARVASGLMAAGAAAGLLGVARPSGRRRARSAARRGGAVVVLLAAIVGTLRAQLDLGASWRIGVDEDERTELMTGGSFAAVRNPIFTAVAAFALGTALGVPGLLTWLGAAAVIAGIEVQVRAVEEPYLARVHGHAYADYAARVGRFVPGVGTVRQ